MAIAAFVALLHDIVITIGVYALVGFPVAPATVIGLLTILGYSLYDTVVVFDKVRENTAGLLDHRSESTYSEAANLALNQTLVRSINTSLTALHPGRVDPVHRRCAARHRARSTTCRWCCSSACCPAPTPRSSSPPRCSPTSRSASRSTRSWPSRVKRRAAGGRAAQRAAADAVTTPRPAPRTTACGRPGQGGRRHRRHRPGRRGPAGRGAGHRRRRGHRARRPVPRRRRGTAGATRPVAGSSPAAAAARSAAPAQEEEAVTRR